jgi:hypothetical protein
VKNVDITSPRESGRAAIKATVPEQIWAENDRFTQSLRAKLLRHPLSTHPIREFFDTETMSKEKTLVVHLEFGYGFAQIFTDAVLNAMAQATQLEPRIGPRGKVTARFLWALNLMDELGYSPSGTTESYAGHPLLAHYFQFVQLFKDLNSKENALTSYVASDAARGARRSFENEYGDYARLTTILALSESIFDKYAGSWADNVKKSTGVDTSQGYHTIHVQDDHGESIDDDHSEDSWTLVKQAITPERYAELDAAVDKWLDCWAEFADNVMRLAVE